MKSKLFLQSRIFLLGWTILTLVVNAQAQRFDPNHIYRIKSVANQLSLEVAGNQVEALQEGRRVSSWDYWGAAKQQWYLRDVGGDLFTIVNRNSGLALTMPTCYRFQFYGTNMWGGQLIDATQSSYTGANNQKWYIAPDPNVANTFRIINFETGMQLTNNGNQDFDHGATVNTRDVKWTANAIQWTLEDVSDNRGVFRIINANSNKALVADPDNNNVYQQTMWYLAYQEWTFSDYNSDGYLTITNRSTGLALEIGGGGDLSQPARKANVWDSWGGDNQQWALLDVNDGRRLTLQEIFTTGKRCKIVNRLSGYVLEIGGGGDLTAEGKQAYQYYDWGGNNQQWFIYIDSANRGANAGSGSQGSASDKATKDAQGTAVLAVYPNPVRNSLTVSLPGGITSAAKVTVTDMRGGTTSAQYKGRGIVDVSNLAAGLYMITVVDGAHTHRQKFLKE